MNVGQFSGPVAKLQSAIEFLQRSWSQAQEHWDDETSRNLDKTHLQPILRQLNEIIEATSPLSDCMVQARRACAPPNQSR